MKTNLSTVHFRFEWSAINSKHFAVSQFSMLFLLGHPLYWLSRTSLHTIRQKFLDENIWCILCDFTLLQIPGTLETSQKNSCCLFCLTGLMILTCYITACVAAGWVSTKCPFLCLWVFFKLWFGFVWLVL